MYGSDLYWIHLKEVWIMSSEYMIYSTLRRIGIFFVIVGYFVLKYTLKLIGWVVKKCWRWYRYGRVSS